MAEETLRDFLLRRERELTAKIAALKGQLSPLEVELSQIQNAKRRDNSLQDFPWENVPKIEVPAVPERQPLDKFAKMTIKELIVQALIDAFPHGATSTALRLFFRDGYARAVGAASLRTQLHRMRANGILVQEPSNDTWNFANGKRRLYVQYDHPSSRKAMTELRDDPEDEAFLKEVELLAWKEES